MVSYDMLVKGLEDAWRIAGLHEHELIESVQPGTHDRTYKVGLFPDHSEPLDETNIPPWVEVSFSWTAFHQLRSEGYHVGSMNQSLELSWLYNVMVHGPLREKSDTELVRLFQQAVQSTLQRFFPSEAPDTTAFAIEVRRIYHTTGNQHELTYVQLVSPNITDLTDHWEQQEALDLYTLIYSEVELASAVIHALADVFKPSPHRGRGAYRAVDAA